MNCRQVVMQRRNLKADSSSRGKGEYKKRKEVTAERIRVAELEKEKARLYAEVAELNAQVAEHKRADREAQLSSGKDLLQAAEKARLKAAEKEQAKELSPYKRPRRIQIRLEEFEKTSTQKIKRYLYQIALEKL